jgi:hypothetical protein
VSTHDATTTTRGEAIARIEELRTAERKAAPLRPGLRVRLTEAGVGKIEEMAAKREACTSPYYTARVFKAGDQGMIMAADYLPGVWTCNFDGVTVLVDATMVEAV